ncbi:MAG: TIGR03086 family metal-binding protein [Haloechinothrix sp.]
MELLDAHHTAMDGFDRIVRRATDQDWSLPTPCTEWNVRDLVNHLVYEQLWAPELLHGATLEEVGDRFDGDVLGEDPAASWTEAAGNARAAFAEPGALDRSVHVSVGQIPATDYGWQMITDLAVHGWDLATAIGVPSAIGDELANQLLEIARPQVDSWQAAGIFAPPVETATDAPPTDQLVALLGRQPR